MADIYQCPRCGAITYREGITLHDRYHDQRDREQATLLERIEDAEDPQLQEWPSSNTVVTWTGDALDETAEADAETVEPATPGSRSW